MTDAPKRIWALSDRRKHWQEHAPDDGQHPWHWKEYHRADLSTDLVRAGYLAALEVAKGMAQDVNQDAEYFGNSDVDNCSSIYRQGAQEVFDLLNEADPADKEAIAAIVAQVTEAKP